MEALAKIHLDLFVNHANRIRPYGRGAGQIQSITGGQVKLPVVNATENTLAFHYPRRQ